MKFIEELASRRRFGMKPGLEAISSVCAAMGNPERSFPAVHIAGTNGKGAVAAMIERAALEAGLNAGRYTSPHLVSINERFFLGGRPASDDALDSAARKFASLASSSPAFEGLSYFEALTAVAFLLYAEAKVGLAVLETGLGGRLDATNVCRPRLSVITRIGLDHCEWLGDTVEAIALEKAGIIKPGVPVVLGANDKSVVEAVKAKADSLGSPFHYAPHLASEADIPADFALEGAFNRENAVTALAALKILGLPAEGFSKIVWPGRYQKIGRFIVDGAHNPPAARALAKALKEDGEKSLALIAGFCGDKDAAQVLDILAPFTRRAFAVKTSNPRSLSEFETAARMTAAGMDAVPARSLANAMRLAKGMRTLVCGSLFLAGEALVELGAYPWGEARFDPAEKL